MRMSVRFHFKPVSRRRCEARGIHPPSGWEVLPIRLEDGRPIVRSLLVGSNLRGYEGDFLVDTGSNFAITLLPGFAQRHRLPPDDSPTLKDPALGVAKPSPAVAFAMEGFRLGTMIFAAPYVRARQSGAGDERGLIGGAVLRQLRFAIDYPSEFGRSIGIDLAGIRLRWEGNDYSRPTVQDVLPGRAAAKAGLQTGDEIVEPRMTATELMEILRRPGSTVSLLIARGNERKPVALKLEPLLEGRF
jgi:membrane-associated protease RseP (regulator of RpoE activity)